VILFIFAGFIVLVFFPVIDAGGYKYITYGLWQETLEENYSLTRILTTDGLETLSISE